MANPGWPGQTPIPSRIVIRFPEVPPGEPLVISATLYVTYAKCPDQALGRLRGLYPPESPASFKGGLAHRIFARHLRSGEIAPGDFGRACKEEIGTGDPATVERPGGGDGVGAFTGCQRVDADHRDFPAVSG